MMRHGLRRGIGPGAGRFGRLGVAIVAAILAEPNGLALAENTEAPTLVLDANGVDLDLNAATAALSRATSGIGVDETDGVHYDLNQGQVVEQKGLDGAVRRVRIVAP
jgi:hypothetical protein